MSNSYSIGFEPQALFWTTSRSGATKVQLCGSKYYLGGKDVFQSVGDYMERTYKVLVSHNIVGFYMKILLVDQWTKYDRVSILLNGYEVGFQSSIENIHKFGSFQCGTSNYADLELTSYGYVPHTGSSLTLKIINRRVSPNWNGTILISDINLLFDTISGTLSQFTQTYPVPYISGASNPTCRFKTYYLSGTGCKPCHVSCEYCYGPSNTQCFKCNSTTYWNGGACISCDSTCRICHGTSSTQCDYCTGSRYLIDNQCVSCDMPFIRNAQYFGQCIYPCKSGEYLYSDSSCYTFCDPRFISTTKYSKAVCNNPCSGSSIRYYNSACVNLACPYPLQMIRYGSYYICEYPCATGLLLYADGSCQNPTLCVYPLVVHTYTTYSSWQACGSVCTYGFYRYHNDTCHVDCPAPLIAKNKAGILICDPPRCGPNQCNSCTSWNTCPDYYTCNVNIGSWCLFKHTYSLVIKSLKSVMNGVVYSVTVTPLIGIGEFNDDILKPEIDGLTKGDDYDVTIKKVDAGTFEVTFVFNTDLDETKYNGTMYYSPATLGLEQDFKFPHITYISDEVQEAAKNISVTSQITFILFLIGIFGMVFGGGIASLWTSVPESQYMYYLIYLNVDYLHHTTLYFKSLANYDMLVGDNTGPQLDFTIKASLPSKFFDLNYSPDFYENTDQVFLQLIFMVSGLFIGTLSLRYLRLPKDLAFIQKFFSYILGVVKWNGLIRQFMTYILPFSTAAFIQIYAAVFGQVKQSLFSLILAPATMVVVVWFLALTRNLIVYIPNEKYQKIAHKRFFGTLWENLVVNSIGKHYFWIGAIRNIVLAYVAVFFEFSPYLQIITLMVYQTFVVLLYFQKSANLLGIGLRPIFEDKALTIITLIQDILLLIMKTMILVFLNCQGTAKDGTLILLGWMIILPGILSQVVQTGFSLLNQVRNRQKIWRKFLVMFHKLSFQKKKKKIKRVKAIKPFRNTPHQALNTTEAQNETQGTQREETQITLPS